MPRAVFPDLIFHDAGIMALSAPLTTLYTSPGSRARLSTASTGPHARARLRLTRPNTASSWRSYETTMKKCCTLSARLISWDRVLLGICNKKVSPRCVSRLRLEPSGKSRCSCLRTRSRCTSCKIKTRASISRSSAATLTSRWRRHKVSTDLSAGNVSHSRL